MAKFYLGTVSSPDLVKFFLMRKFKSMCFPHEESIVDDLVFDLYYISQERNPLIEAIFNAFMCGFERGLKFQLENT